MTTRKKALELFGDQVVKGADEALELADKITDLLDGKSMPVGTFAMGQALASIMVWGGMDKKGMEQFVKRQFPTMVLGLADITADLIQKEEEETEGGTQH